LAVAALARRGLRWLLSWRASRCDAKVPRVPPRAAAAWPLLRSLGAGCAGFYAGARHGVARGGTCAASGGCGLAVVALAQRKLRRLLRWRASRCGARRHVCCCRRWRLRCRSARSAQAAPASTLARVTVLRGAAHVLPRGWRLGCRRARSAKAAPASTLARVTVWRGAAHVPPQVAAAWQSLRSLDAGCAGFYAVARVTVCGARWHVCCLRRRRLGRCCARSARAAPASTLARVTVWRKAACVPPQAAVVWPSSRSLSASCAGFYAGARHGVARGCTCAASGGGGLAVAALARRGQRRLMGWRASRCGAWRHICWLRRRRLGRRCARSTRAAPAPELARITVWRGVARLPPQAAAAWPLLRSLDAGCAGFYTGARHGVARGRKSAASGSDGSAVAALARRGLRRLLGWRASRCGGGRHMCRLRRRRLGRHCAHSTRAAPASTLARVTVWREAALVLPQAVAASLSLRLLDAGCAGSWAGAHDGVARDGTCAASGGGGLAIAALARRGLRRLLCWCASRCGAKVARVPAQAAAAWPSLRSLGAGCAGFYAGARHGVARGGTCAASGGGGLAVAALARRGLRRLLRWRASRCGARQHVCRLRR